MTQGKIWHVKPYSGRDSRDGKTADTAVKTLTKALAKATANKNDIVLLYAESNTAASTTDYQSVGLDWNKDSVHLIGVGGNPFMGQRARIAQHSSALTVTDLVTVSANNCIISGLEIYQGVSGATAATSRALVVSGMRNRIIDSQISGIGHLDIDDAASCSLAITGSENYFGNSYIGLDTVLRTTSVSEVNISGNGTRTVLDNCIINSYVASAATTFKAITIAAGSYHTATWLRNCMLCSETNRTGATAAQTGAILHSGAGNVFMLDGGVFGYVDVSTLANAAIFMLTHQGLSTAANFPGIAQGVAPS
jgi:hypothetical protein